MNDNNVNDNVNVKKTMFSINDNVNDNEGKFSKARQVDYIADQLIQRFGLNETSRGFMCKVAYKLPEARIWQHYEHVTTPRKDGKPITNPVGLFIWLCKKDGV